MRLLAYAALLALPVVAHAISPATHEDLLCNASHVAQARIKSAQLTPTPCGVSSKDYCFCSGELVVSISSLWGIKKSVANYPEDVGISPGKDVRLAIQHSPLPQGPTVQICTEYESSILGKSFLFSISTTYGPWSDGTTRVSRPPYFANIWPESRSEWVQQTLRSRDGNACPVNLQLSAPKPQQR